MTNIVSRQVSVHQEHEFLSNLSRAGLETKLAQTVIESPENVLAERIITLIKEEAVGLPGYYIDVDSGIAISDLIRAGQYSDVSEAIARKSFEHLYPTQSILSRMFLMGINDCLTTEQVLLKIYNRGLRPATLREFLVFGMTYPYQNLFGRMAALGSYHLSHGERYSPCLFKEPRRLSTIRSVPGNGEWHDSWVFAVMLMDD
jgi:hypothetical protein